MTAVDIGDTVVTGQAFVEEGVVGGEEVGDTPVFAEDTAEEELGFRAQGLTEIVVKIDEETLVGRDRFQSPQVKPLGGKIGHQILRPWIGQHPARLLFENFGPVQFVAFGHGQ